MTVSDGRFWGEPTVSDAHDIDFSRGESLPLCRRCGQSISDERWAALEPCPGPLTCRPPYAHVYLNGRLRCECGACDDAVLLEMLTEEARR